MKLPNSSSVKEDFSLQIKEKLSESIETKQEVLRSLVPQIDGAAQLLIKVLSSGHKLLLFGNGGSAADSQHIAAELVGKLLVKRKALAAISLTTDTSNLTALANDFGYENVFQRQVEALGKEGDVAIGISTSGESPNVVCAMETARKMKLATVALTGRKGGRLITLADVAICIPSDSTQRIQEAHITIGHILCELIEDHFSRF